MKIFLAAVVGFILGAMLFRTPAAKAQVGAGVNVKLANDLNGNNSVLGSRVVGFSCVSKGPGSNDCYIATQ
jgi:hypothetical protein